jgi:ATP-dependent Clp protease protease subunit
MTKAKDQNITTMLGERGIPIRLDSDERLPIIWVSDFGPESAREFFEMFTMFHSDDSVESILVYIDSFGGSVDSLATMAEIIESSHKHVITACVGKAFSAGALLLSLGDERWVAPNSRVMLHKIRIVLCEEMDADEVREMAKELTTINEKWLKKAVARSNMTWKDFMDKIHKSAGDWYLSPKDAVKFGFADHIGMPIVREVRQWRINS